MIHYEVPEYKKDAFNCPHCDVYAHQRWTEAWSGEQDFCGTHSNIDLAFCEYCDGYSLWHDEIMIYPFSKSAPLPHPDFPDEIKDDYEEARAIVSQSPRGAAALLRLAIQKLCKCLGEEGKNINTDIGNLVRKGLPNKIQKVLDIVRVIGNNAVHPGQMDLKDDTETAERLFKLVNLIVEEMITVPRQVDQLYDSLPEGSREAIARRDGQEQ